jgi:hypothetical protein
MPSINETSRNLRERLDELMAIAIHAYAGNADVAIDEFIKALLAEDDAAALMWELFDQVRMTAIRHLFTNTLYRVQQQEKTFGGSKDASPRPYPYPTGDGKSGHSSHDAQITGAAKPSPGTASSMPRANASVKPGGPMSTVSKGVPPAGASLKPKAQMPAVPPQPPRGRQPTFATLSSAANASKAMYDRTFINGKSIGDLTIEEALRVKVREKRLAKWIDLMTSQVIASQISPTSKRRIREFIAEEESDRYYDMAQQEEDDAA